jgi:hypothetical protein
VAVPIARRGQGVVVAKQLVGAVDQIDFRGAAPAPTLTDRRGPDQPHKI